jgi:hypothetical protein
MRSLFKAQDLDGYITSVVPGPGGEAQSPGYVDFKWFPASQGSFGPLGKARRCKCRRPWRTILLG